MELTQPRFRYSILLDIYNGYPLALIAALSLHFLVLAALVYSGITRPPQNPEIVQPSVRAFTIDENPQLRNERLQQERQAASESAAAERRRQEQLEQQRAEEAAAAEQRRQEQLEQQQEQEAAAAERRRQEQLQQQQAAEAAEAAAERRRQEELERQRREEAAAEQRRQQELASQRAEAEAAAAAAAADVARTQQEMVMAYTGIIHDLIQQNWSRPPSARNGMTTVFRIQMVPTGDILDVELVQSSGDYAFDRAAESAIYRVGRFQELQGMPINLFNENFRSLLLTFRPEDLLN